VWRENLFQLTLDDMLFLEKYTQNNSWGKINCLLTDLI
jgi:hypothetical protein